MELVENIRSLVEDSIHEYLYESYSERFVDKFLSNFDDEVVTTEIMEMIEQLAEMVFTRAEEIEVMAEDAATMMKIKKGKQHA